MLFMFASKAAAAACAPGSTEAAAAGGHVHIRRPATRVCARHHRSVSGSHGCSDCGGKPRITPAGRCLHRADCVCIAV